MSLPGTKNVKAKRDVPLTDAAKEVLGTDRCIIQWLHLPGKTAEDEAS